MSWTNSYPITIDHTKVLNTDQSNFPFSFSGMFAELRSTANGGTVTSSSGFDILFASDAAGNSPLSYEREYYDPASGRCSFWVKIPTLSHTVDTVIYLLTGNSSITTDQSNKTAVWDANYQGVWHFNGPSPTFGDSTANGITGTGTNTSVSLGAIQNSVVLNGSAWVDMGQSKTALQPATTLTVEAWFTPSTTNQNSYSTFVNQDYSANPRNNPFTGYALFANYNGTNRFFFVTANTSGNKPILDSGVSYAANQPYHVVGTYDGANMRIYVNGVLSGTTPQTGSLTYSNGNFRIGANSANGETLQGSVDEVRISNSVRSADWITASYNNQFYGSKGFYSTTLTDTSSRQLWLDASQISGATDGQSITTWPDLSGYGNNATLSSGTLTYHASQVNSKPALTLGSAKLLLAQSIAKSSGNTLFVVFNQTGNGKGGFLGGPSGSAFFWSGNGTNPTLGADIASQTGLGNGSALSLNHWYYVTYQFTSGSSLVLRENGGLDTTINTSSSNSAVINAVGFNNSNGGEFFAGQIAELIYYNRTLSASEVSSVESYLQSKYAITSNPNARVTQIAREVLQGPGNPNARVTQIAREVLTTVVQTGTQRSYIVFLG